MDLFGREGPRMKHVEYMLLTAFTGAFAIVVRSMPWIGVVKLAAAFTQVGQALQLRP
jgi:hypothetical protein